jgi:hypothetical protein
LVASVAGFGALTPGYDHVSRFISELGARGAPFEGAVRLGAFTPVGVLLLAFCAAAYTVLPRSRWSAAGFAGLAVFAAGYLVAAVFPCDPGCRPPEPSVSQVIHNTAGLAGYLVAPGFLAALSLAARRWTGSGWLGAAGSGMALTALAGLLTLSPELSTVGASQRLIEASVVGWACLCGVYLVRRGGG